MERDELRSLLKSIQDGKLDLDTAMKRLRNLPYEDLGYARVDHHRNLRTGFPEVIYCSGKEIEQVQGIAAALLTQGSNLLLTRASEEIFASIQKLNSAAVFHQPPGLVVVQQRQVQQISGTIVVLTAGTADLPVAEEAAIVAEFFGNQVERLYDVGVAGIHRLLASLELLQEARVIIAVAGMEGALASVVGGLVDKPVIAVPTSVGYGTSFGGLAALLAMLNTCAAGVSVMNIDNGFGAGCLASIINRQVDQALHTIPEQDKLEL